MEKPRNLLYAYVEYCPGDFYWGWWFYLAPVVDLLPKRRDGVGGNWEWLRPGGMGLPALLKALGLEPVYETYAPYHVDNDLMVEEFLKAHPNGALVYDGEPFAHYKAAGEVEGVEPWRCLMHVRESQLLDWKNSDKSYLAEREERMAVLSACGTARHKDCQCSTDLTFDDKEDTHIKECPQHPGYLKGGAHGQS